MASILEAQIDFLGEQIHLLPADAHNAKQIEEAAAVSLLLLNQIIASADPSRADSNQAILTHWLRSAEAILAAMRELKRTGEHLAVIHPFMRAILKARAMASYPNSTDTEASWTSLDEVERELQRGAD